MDENNTSTIFQVSDSVAREVIRGYQKDAYCKGYKNGSAAATIKIGAGVAFFMLVGTAIYLGDKLVKEITEDTNDGYVTVQREQSSEQK